MFAIRMQAERVDSAERQFAYEAHQYRLMVLCLERIYRIQAMAAGILGGYHAERMNPWTQVAGHPASVIHSQISTLSSTVGLRFNVNLSPAPILYAC